MPRKKPARAGKPQPPANPSQEDIAKYLGVSAMTVSRALRGSTAVKAETRRLVQDTARELGFRPNPLMQAFMANMHRQRKDCRANLAWVDSFKPGHHTPELLSIMDGARRRAEELGYGLDVVPIDAIPNRAAAKRIFDARGVYGAVIGPLKLLSQKLDLPWSDYAFASVGRSLNEPRFHYSIMNHAHSMNHIVQLAINRGYRRIAYFCDCIWDQRTENAPIMVYRDHQARQPVVTFLEPQFHVEWKTRDYRRWFDDHKPDMIIGDYIRVAHHFIEADVMIPNDVAFATLSWRWQEPHFSGIRIRYDALGAAAIDLILGQLHRNERGEPDYAKAVFLEGEWMEGRTFQPVCAPHKSQRI